MAQAAASPRKVHLFLYTERKDAWWVQPLITFIVFTSFIVYATWAAFQNEYYAYGSYLSPFYSPEFFGSSPHALFGPKPGWWPGWLPFSPALIILPFPGLFRFTCYYYRGAYYKAFWGDPPSCTVGEPRKSYWGENSFPLILQNVHRYFMYAAVIIWSVLCYDAWVSLWWPDGFHLGLGSVILIVNAILLAGYTFGCHSLRHIIGGGRDTLRKGAVGKSCYDCVSGLNKRHQTFAWCSLFSVALCDIYIRLLSMGVITDWRII